MPIILERQSNVEGNFTPAEREAYIRLVSSFRLFIADDDPERNILDMKKFSYTDQKVVELIDLAKQDINLYAPLTSMSVLDIYQKNASMLLVKGAVVFALIREGLLHVKNKVNYNDSGLNINFFDKSPDYQSWIGMLLNSYMQERNQFKSSVIPSSANAGFYGIHSEFSYMDDYWGAYY